MEKKVRAKKVVRKTSASPLAAVAVVFTIPGLLRQIKSMITKVRAYPMINLGNLCQISTDSDSFPGFHSITVVQITARMNAQTPIKMSMKILTVVAVASIHPGSYLIP